MMFKHLICFILNSMFYLFSFIFKTNQHKHGTYHKRLELTTKLNSKV